MLGWGKGRHRKSHNCTGEKRCIHGKGFGHCHNTTLNNAVVNKKYVILSNPDRKTVEMGVFNGGIITVQKNDSTDPNLVIAVGESRYIMSRAVAERIIVR